MNINYDKLRIDLLEKYGDKLRNDPLAIFDVNKVQNASDKDLEYIALKNGFKLTDYKVIVKRYF